MLTPVLAFAGLSVFIAKIHSLKGLRRANRQFSVCIRFLEVLIFYVALLDLVGDGDSRSLQLVLRLMIHWLESDF